MSGRATLVNDLFQTFVVSLSVVQIYMPLTLEEVLTDKKYSNSFILLILSISLFFGLSLWFAPNAVFDQLIPIYNLTQADLSLISIAVIAGFIIGSLLIAFFNLPDIMRPERLFFLASLFGALTNALVILTSNFLEIWILRFFTGTFLAGIYPVGLKLTASHFKVNRGFAIGILLSALTAGSGLPYLFNFFGEPDWKLVIILVSCLAFICGLLVIVFVEKGPFVGSSSSFDIRAIKVVYSKRSVRLANYAYFGHMWELYAFWVWMPIFLRESYRISNPQATELQVLQFFSGGSFLIFLSGALANIVGGYVADRIGRTKFNIIMLSLSGLSGFVIGFFFRFPVLALLVATIWGITVIPDSPQYSTMITELANQKLVGTALNIQLAIGFTITMISVRLIPFFVSILNWDRTFMVLSIGPLWGILSLIRLRRQDDAVLIAGGKK